MLTSTFGVAFVSANSAKHIYYGCPNSMYFDEDGFQSSISLHNSAPVCPPHHPPCEKNRESPIRVLGRNPPPCKSSRTPSPGLGWGCRDVSSVCSAIFQISMLWTLKDTTCHMQNQLVCMLLILCLYNLGQQRSYFSSRVSQWK